MTETVVTEVGPLALSFEDDKVMIFFGPSVPSELKEFSVVHEVKQFSATDFHVSAKLTVDAKEYTVTAVGHEAVEKMEQLGHVVVYFTEVPEDILPGAIYAEPHVVPVVSPGTVVRFN